MTRVLIIDDDSDHAERVRNVLAQRGLVVVCVPDTTEALKTLQAGRSVCEIVILVITDPSRPWLTVLSKLQEAAQQGAIVELPLFLCVSKGELGAEFQLRIERMGARYACEE